MSETSVEAVFALAMAEEVLVTDDVVGALLGGTEDDDGSGAADEAGATAVDVGAVDGEGAGDGAGVLEATGVD